MLDDSAKAGKDGFKKSQRFAKNFVEWFNVKQDGTHVGVMTYSDVANLQMPLPKPGSAKPSQTLSELSFKIDNLEYSGGKQSKLDVALGAAAAQVFPPDNLGRKDSKKVNKFDLNFFPIQFILGITGVLNNQVVLK